MMNHLHPNTIKLLDLSDEERILKISSEKWLEYPRAGVILSKLEDILMFPPSHRPQNLLIAGDPNTGKTALLRRFCSRHPQYVSESEGKQVWPVLYIQMPPEPDERRFYNVILDRVFAPYRIHDRPERKQLQVIQILSTLKVRMLIVDEIQHILAGSQAKQNQFRNVIKYLSNELQIPIVGAGIRTAFNAIKSDEQLASRFESVTLTRWTLSEDYFRLLASYEFVLPLRKPSELTDDALSYKILSMSEGTIGEIFKIIRMASIQAIRQGTERITLPILQQLNYTPASQRMKQTS